MAVDISGSNLDFHRDKELIGLHRRKLLLCMIQLDRILINLYFYGNKICLQITVVLHISYFCANIIFVVYKYIKDFIHEHISFMFTNIFCLD